MSTPDVWTGPELLPMPPARVQSLAMVRARESRLFAELWTTAREAIRRAWAFSVHHEWLYFGMSYLEREGVTPDDYGRTGTELKRQLARLHKHGDKLLAPEEDDVRTVAALCLAYARALGDLARAEKRYISRI